MAKRKLIESGNGKFVSNNSTCRLKQFHIELLDPTQEKAYDCLHTNDITFLVGEAGTGKTHLALSFAIQEILDKSKDKILLSRPVVEAGESLGYLPGDIHEKVYPYMLPFYDILDKMCGKEGGDRREYVNRRVELAPLAYLRGRTFSDAICILDEAQNCTAAQLKLFLTRLGHNSKMIITGDPNQSDLPSKTSALLSVIDKISSVNGICVVEFTEETIVRHPLVREIVKLI